MGKISLIVTLVFIAIESGYSQKIEFYDSAGLPTLSEDCYYFMSGEYSISTGWTDTVKTFYCKTRKLRSREFYNVGTREGPGYYYHPNGRLKEKIVYKNDLIIGLVTQFYPTGKASHTKIYLDPNQITIESPFNYLIINAWNSSGVQTVKNYHGYFKDELEEGKVKNGLRDSIWVTFDSKGRKILVEEYKDGSFIEGDRFIENHVIHFSDFETSASPKEGFEKLYQFVGKGLRYPVEARRNGTQGKVFIQFVIEANGSISDVKIKKGFNPDCDVEAMRVVTLFKPWNPGYRRGLPSRQAFTMPISFKLE